jgi:hypothetical protein
MAGEMVTAIALKEAFCATELSITQEGIPATISSGGMLLGLAGIADPIGETGRGGNSRLIGNTSGLFY